MPRLAHHYKRLRSCHELRSAGLSGRQLAGFGRKLCDSYPSGSDFSHRLLTCLSVNMPFVGYGFPSRNSLIRCLSHLFTLTLVLIWTGMASPLVPLMAAQCRLAMLKTGCHGAHSSPGNHLCCHGKSVPTPQNSAPRAPICPMHEGMLPNSCSMAAASCCAIVESEPTSRRAMKPERRSGDQKFAVQVVATNASSFLSPRSGPERRARPGLLYEKPVLELKTDLRV